MAERLAFAEQSGKGMNSRATYSNTGSAICRAANQLAVAEQQNQRLGLQSRAQSSKQAGDCSAANKLAGCRAARQAIVFAEHSKSTKVHANATQWGVLHPPRRRTRGPWQQHPTPERVQPLLACQKLVHPSPEQVQLLLVRVARV